MLIAVEESLLKRFFRTFFEEDLTAAIKELQTAENNVTKVLARYTLRLVDLGSTLKYFVRPHLKDQALAGGARFSLTRDWLRSPIRVICWHPNTFKMAVAASDDSIRIYTDVTGIIPQLKCGQQRGITSMAWRPFASAELAVGCQNGVVLWSLQMHSTLARPFNNSQLLKVANHYPVSAVDWNSNGCECSGQFILTIVDSNKMIFASTALLVSASLNDSDLIVWDIDYGRHTALKRVGHPCALIKWSPDDLMLLSSTVGGVFRVWTTDKWTPERWTVKSGSIQSVAWSPCGLHLLFVTTEDQFIYALKFANEQLFNSAAVPKQALPVADLNNLDDSDTRDRTTPQIRRPQALAWDGKYLAVSYKDASDITIFRASANYTNLSLSPFGTVTGTSPDEFPTQICFQLNKLRNHEAMLTIGWSSGRIQYYPVF